MKDPNPSSGRGYLIEELAGDFKMKYVEALIDTGKVKLDVECIGRTGETVRDYVTKMQNFINKAKEDEKEKSLKEELIKALNDDNLEEFKQIAKKMKDPNPSSGRGYLIEELAGDLKMKYVEALIDTGKVKLDVPSTRDPNISVREYVSQRKELLIEIRKLRNKEFDEILFRPTSSNNKPREQRDVSTMKRSSSEGVLTTQTKQNNGATMKRLSSEGVLTTQTKQNNGFTSKRSHSEGALTTQTKQNNGFTSKRSYSEGALTEKKTKSKNNWKNFSIKSLIKKFGLKSLELKPLRNNHRGRENEYKQR